MEAKRYILTEKEAVEVVTNALHEIYSHRPTRFSVCLSGAVDELPTLEVSYTGLEYRIPVGEEYEVHDA